VHLERRCAVFDECQLSSVGSVAQDSYILINVLPDWSSNYWDKGFNIFKLIVDLLMSLISYVSNSRISKLCHWMHSNLGFLWFIG
jgi:hypothetical protein